MRLNRLFQNGMMLQREKPIRVFGDADASSEVTVKITDKDGTVISEGSGQADADGHFLLELPPVAAGRGLTLTAKCGEDEVTVSDVDAGEIFLAGGQSNMEFNMWYEMHYQQAIHEGCLDPDLRFYDVPEVSFAGQEEIFKENLSGIWRKAAVDQLGHFSAVGWYFQKELKRDLNVPVGIIGCNWGGSASVAWMKRSSVEAEGAPWMARFAEWSKDITDFDAYYEQQKHVPMNDRGRYNLDVFSSFMLPENRTMEEAMAFFRSLGFGGGGTTAFTMMPHMVPGAMYEHMVLAIAPFVTRGVLWYQGESDDGPDTAPIYAHMMSTVIRDWREAFRDELPFFMVQLPGFYTWFGNYAQCYDVLRDQQEEVCRCVPEVYMASVSDTGERIDIHPKNKKAVGERLALLVRKYVYGEDILADAPEFESAGRTPEGLVLYFRNTGSGLRIAEDVKEAEEAAEASCPEVPSLKVLVNGTEQPVHAEAEENRLIVSGLSLRAGDCVEVRFAKTQYFLVNLYNSAGIPAKPFAVKFEDLIR